MITLGYITKINNPDDNIYEVRLPIFEKAGSSKDLPDLSGSYFQATLSQTPGQLNGFLVGDCVVVGFLDNKYSKPVILGKLFVGDDGARGYLNVNALSVSGSVSLGGDIHIGDITYDQLLELVRGVPNLQEQVDKLLAGGGGGEPDNYIVSASVSGNDLTLTPNTGNPIVYSPSTITSVNWGDIEGTLSDQTDLQEALDEKLELYEVTQSDIENVVSGNIIFTKDFSDKVRSMKYLLKVNKQLFNPQAADEDIYLKPETRETMNGYATYTYASISGFFETYVDSVIFGYDPSIDRCLSNNDLVHHIIIPQTIVADNNSIQLDSGDGGRIGSPVSFATINNQPIVGGGNIDTPNDNDYHEPRFNNGLSIASSSNVSEIYVPYATSSTYGVLKDIYYPSSNPSNFASQDYVNTMAAYAYASAVSYVDSKLTSYATQSYAETAAYYAYSSAIAYTDSKLSSYATQEYADNVAYLAGSTAYASAVSYVDSNYLPLSGGTITGSLSVMGNVNAQTLSIASFGITPYENGIDITNTYGTINVENYNGGNIYLATSSGSVIMSAYGISMNADAVSVNATSGFFYNGYTVATTFDIGSSTLTLQLDGSDVGTFNANATSNVTVNFNLSNVYASKSWVLDKNYVDQSDLDSAVYYGYVSAVSYVDTTLSSYATKDYVGSTLSGYVPYVTGTSDISVGNVNARTLDIASFGITPYENGVDITNSYGNLNIETFGGNFNITTSSGIAYYNGAEIGTKSYAEYVASLAYASAVSAASSYTDTRVASANSYAEYVAAVAYASAVSYLNKPLNLSLNGYGIGTYYPSSGATINLNLSASGYTTVVANPQAPTTSTLTSIAIGGVNYLLPSGSGGGGGGDYVPYSGASRYVDLNKQNITNVTSIYAEVFNLANAQTSGSVYIAYESFSYRLRFENQEGTIQMDGERGISFHTDSGNINFWPDSSHKLYYGSSYWSNEVATIGTFEDYGITQFSGSLSLNSPFGITLSAASGSININGTELLFNSSPLITENDLDGYATEDYVDNHHTMVNATSLTDVDIDKILVKGGIVILDDEQLSLTLAPPGEQMSLTMTNSINNDSTLSPTMLNTINNNDNVGLTPTMVNTELSI